MNILNSRNFSTEEKFLFEVFCVVCNCSLNIKLGGKSNISLHILKAKQKK